jgi:hypothetical protein
MLILKLRVYAHPEKPFREDRIGFTEDQMKEEELVNSLFHSRWTATD